MVCVFRLFRKMIGVFVIKPSCAVEVSVCSAVY